MSTNKFFQRLTKLHEPLGRVQYVVIEKIYKCLFISNSTRKIMWLLVNDIREKKYDIAYHNYTEASAHIKCKNNLFKPCIPSKQLRTIKIVIYKDILTSQGAEKSKTG